MKRSDCDDNGRIFKYPKRASSIQYFFSYDGALEHAKNRSENSDEKKRTVFAVEVAQTGSRRYLVATTEDFWESYITHKTKNFYELIESSKCCKLYLDVEYYKAENPSKDGEKAVRRLIQLIVEKLRSNHGIHTSEDDCLILEASSVEKFSTHLIFVTTKFDSNYSCGHFVKDMMSRCQEEDRELFLVKTKLSTMKSMVDTQVYSRNRQFRLFLSSKFGEQRPLVLSTMDRSIKKSQTIECQERQIFELSLITNCSNDATLIELPKPMTANILISSPKKLPDNNSSTTYSDIEEAINKIITPGHISVKRNLEGGRVTYKISGYNYCRIKKSNHSSKNQIYFVHNPKTHSIVQHCWNAQCKMLPPVDIIF